MWVSELSVHAVPAWRQRLTLGPLAGQWILFSKIICMLEAAEGSGSSASFWKWLPPSSRLPPTPHLYHWQNQLRVSCHFAMPPQHSEGRSPALQFPR